jgi:putative flippase GtrA
MLGLNNSQREASLFLLSGAIQFGLDLAIFSALVLMFGTHLSINVVSRGIVGIAGFYVNGFVVFQKLQKQTRAHILSSFLKFLTLLLLMTSLSSFLLSFFNSSTDLVFILAKFVVEAILAILSFLIQRNIVYASK